MFLNLKQKRKEESRFAIYLCCLCSYRGGGGGRHKPLFYIGGRRQLPFSCNIFFGKSFIFMLLIKVSIFFLVMNTHKLTFC
jgi:hypothetical protein